MNTKTLEWIILVLQIVILLLLIFPYARRRP
jgi:hypothetical protein